jgi:hypothetical protein
MRCVDPGKVLDPGKELDPGIDMDPGCLIVAPVTELAHGEASCKACGG